MFQKFVNLNPDPLNQTNCVRFCFKSIELAIMYDD